MKTFRRNQNKSGRGKMKSIRFCLFVGTPALMLSLFFVVFYMICNHEEPLNLDFTKAKTGDNTPHDHLIHNKPKKKHHVKEHPILKNASPQKKETQNSDLVDPKYRIVFSTDCSGYQKWQTYLLFYSAYKIQQPGTITRIASGCTVEQEAIEREFHSNISRHMSSNFKLHITPDFSEVIGENGQDTEETYAYFNKPFGLLHWFEYSGEKIKDDDIIILIDPDQVLTRPITHDFSKQTGNSLIGDNPRTIVEHGSPFAQMYQLGALWQNFDEEKITGTKESPAKNVTRKDALAHYQVGPPYLATARDMHLIARKWSEFVPRTYEQYPDLLAEMYAFCIAAAHLKMPHQLVRLMVSNVNIGEDESGGEGWDLVQAIDDEDICSPTVMVDYTLPPVLHYCNKYKLGKHIFGKHRIPTDILSCESPLLSLPAQDIVKKYDYYIPPLGTDSQREKLDDYEVKENAFMLCALTRLVNEASLFYHSKNCEIPKDPEVVIDLWLKEKVLKNKYV